MKVLAKYILNINAIERGGTKYEKVPRLKKGFFDWAQGRKEFTRVFGKIYARKLARLRA